MSDNRYPRYVSGAPEDYRDLYSGGRRTEQARSTGRLYEAARDDDWRTRWRDQDERAFDDRSDRDDRDRYSSGRSGADRDHGYAADRNRGYRQDWREREARGSRYDSRPQRQHGMNDRDYDYEDRGFVARAGDEMASWFGDDEAARRRELDRRYDERHGQASDAFYSKWRQDRISELDRDYDEYRREHADRFHQEFQGWRTDRQGQRDSLSRVAEHMEVVGSDGTHIGTVDKVRGDRIILTKNDRDADGRHHSIPSRWIQTVDDKVMLRKTAEEAQAHWRDEERSGQEPSGGTTIGQSQSGDRWQTTGWRND